MFVLAIRALDGQILKSDEIFLAYCPTLQQLRYTARYVLRRYLTYLGPHLHNHSMVIPDLFPFAAKFQMLSKFRHVCLMRKLGSTKLRSLL